MRHAAYQLTYDIRLPELPSHWRLTPVRGIVDHSTEKNIGTKSDNYLSVVSGRGVLLYKEKGDIGNKKPDDLEKCKVVRKGNLVINSMNYAIGSYGMSNYDGVCSPVYIILNPIRSEVHPSFALRIFEDTSFQTLAASFGNGILEHRAAIGWDSLKGMKVGLPPIYEQRQIAAYLNRETAKIDRLIAKQERLVELLQEKRQAVISRAVTKGLDSSVKMKDSGVEWLGEVPEHWVVSRISRFFQIQAGGDLKDELFSEEISETHRYPIFTNSTKPDAVYGYTSKYFYPGNSITVTGRGEIGFATYRPEPFDAIIRLLVLAPYGNTYCKYFQYFINSKLSFSENATAIGQLSTQQLSPHLVLYPPADEQKLISDHLDRICEKYDRLESVILKNKGLLTEYRQALISAAVTGKIDVRGLVTDEEVAALGAEPEEITEVETEDASYITEE